MNSNGQPSIETLSDGSCEQQISAWLADSGLGLPSSFSPWQETRRLAIVLGGVGSERDAVITIAALLNSSFQDFRVSLPSTMAPTLEVVSAWIGRDERFSWDVTIDELVGSSEVVMVLPVGIVLTKYSVEALIETLSQPEVSVVRALVPGSRSSLEFWDSRHVLEVGSANAESVAQLIGSERWIDGAALGLHAVGEPAPKVFFRRGVADRHIVDVEVYSDEPARTTNYLVVMRGFVRSVARRLNGHSLKRNRTNG